MASVRGDAPKWRMSPASLLSKSVLSANPSAATMRPVLLFICLLVKAMLSPLITPFLLISASSACISMLTPWLLPSLKSRLLPCRYISPVAMLVPALRWVPVLVTRNVDGVLLKVLSAFNPAISCPSALCTRLPVFTLVLPWAAILLVLLIAPWLTISTSAWLYRLPLLAKVRVLRLKSLTLEICPLLSISPAVIARLPVSLATMPVPALVKLSCICNLLLLDAVFFAAAWVVSTATIRPSVLSRFCALIVKRLACTTPDVLSTSLAICHVCVPTLKTSPSVLFTLSALMLKRLSSLLLVPAWIIFPLLLSSVVVLSVRLSELLAISPRVLSMPSAIASVRSCSPVCVSLPSVLFKRWASISSTRPLRTPAVLSKVPFLLLKVSLSVAVIEAFVVLIPVRAVVLILLPWVLLSNRLMSPPLKLTSPVAIWLPWLVISPLARILRFALLSSNVPSTLIPATRLPLSVCVRLTVVISTLPLLAIVPLLLMVPADVTCVSVLP